MDYIALHDFLKAADKPMTIGEIHAEAPFASYSRRELANGLQTLTMANLAFRRVNQGKAYYSADPSQGSGMNPFQKSVLNKVYKIHAEEISEARRQLRMMDAL